MKFNSKIMLFGEYTVLHKSDALLIPFSRFSGELNFNREVEDFNHDKQQSNNSLNEFYNYLQKEFNNSGISKSFSLNQFKEDIDKGLYFNSNIPIGYGVGSSGALTAAIYQKYVNNPVERANNNLLKLKEHFVFLESFFHGNSSGLDPLVCYLNREIFVHKDVLKIDDVNYSKFHPFLIDTQIAKLTGELVKMYHEKCNNPDFLQLVKSELINANNLCINFLRIGDSLNFFTSLKRLSMLQFNLLKEMILPEYEFLWKLGFESNDFYLKLCGAGGGGYLLGFSHEIETIKKLIKEYELKIIVI